jgi:hypothetical protein
MTTGNYPSALPRFRIEISQRDEVFLADEKELFFFVAQGV